MPILLPQLPESYWEASTPMTEYPPLQENLNADVCVIGGGITGLTTAYLLAKKDIKVVLVDSDRIFRGVTAHTTAKITAQHGMIYDGFTHLFGIEQAKTYFDAQMAGLNFIRNTISEQRINCDYMQEDAYIFTNADEEMTNLQNEYKAYQALGIESAYLERTDLPFQVKAAIVMKNQGQFHPLQYLARLAQLFVEMGGKIYERTVAVDVDESNIVRVQLANEKHITCNHAIVCTHFPFEDKMGFYFARMHAEKSYVLGVKTNQTLPAGMYISAEQPTRSIRQSHFNGEDLLLIGGESHITGRSEDTHLYYENLRDFAEQHFAPTEIKYRWSTQDLVTIDKLPFVGPISQKNKKILVATGFRKWGMTNGTAAAHVLRDIVVGAKSSYADMVDPSRFHANPSIKNLAMNFVDMTREMIRGKTEFVVRTPNDLNNGEGAVVSVHGKRAGGYRDDDGKLHLVDTTCTHMGCELSWNSVECSWDCPCHGSRFNVDGEVMEGPAKKPIKRLST